MKLRYTCDCGHENLWPVFERKISNFVCDGCGEFIGAYGNDNLTFADGKGIGLYKKYDSITEELVLMRYNYHRHDGGLIDSSRNAYTWDGLHISIPTHYNTISDVTWYGNTVTYTVTPNTNYHAHSNYYPTFTFQWHQV